MAHWKGLQKVRYCPQPCGGRLDERSEQKGYCWYCRKYPEAWDEPVDEDTMEPRMRPQLEVPMNLERLHQTREQGPEQVWTARSEPPTSNDRASAEIQERVDAIAPPQPEDICATAAVPETVRLD